MSLLSRSSAAAIIAVVCATSPSFAFRAPIGQGNLFLPSNPAATTPLAPLNLNQSPSKNQIPQACVPGQGRKIVGGYYVDSCTGAYEGTAGIN